MDQKSRTEYAGPVLTQRLNVGAGERSVSVSLIRPVEPDRLLDDPEVLAWNRTDDYMPYWAYLWPGAYLLAEAVAREPIEPGTQALEIGCGLGLAGLVALGRGVRVTFSDYDEAPFPYLRRSAEASGFDREKLDTIRLDWRDLPTDRRFPLILGADVLYERKLVPLVANLLANLLEPNGTALIADPYRVAAEGFGQAARDLGLSAEAKPIEAETAEHGRVRGTLHRVTRPA